MTEEKRCPACGKPTAGYVPCPHCGADPRTSITMKFALVVCVIVLGFGAVFYLMHLATSDVIPTPISSIDPNWMDYSYVWIDGVVSAGPQYSQGSVTFDVYDGSEGSFGTMEEGTIPVEYYNPTENTIPTVGDHVQAFGQLRAPVGGDKELRVSFSSDIYITKAQAVDTTISNILSTWDAASSLQFKRVRVEGTITGIRPLSSAKIYTLSDSGEELELYVHNGLEEFVEKRPIGLNVLDRVRVTTGLSQYSGSPQLSLADFDELEIIGSENVQEVPIQSLNDNFVENMVKVSGKIVFVEAKGGGSDLEILERVLLLDNVYNPSVIASEGTLELLSDNDRALVKRGTTIGLVGEVQRYGGSVRVEWLGPQVPTLASGSYEPPSVENFLTITSDNQNELVTVVGNVYAVSEISVGWLPSHRILTLQDNLGGSVWVYIPNFLYERMQSPPSVGQTIKVIGKVTSASGYPVVVQPGVIEDVQRVS